MANKIVSNNLLKGVEDETGKIIIPCKFSKINPLAGKYFICHDNFGDILYDNDGNILEMNYQILPEDDNQDLFWLKDKRDNSTTRFYNALNHKEITIPSSDVELKSGNTFISTSGTNTYLDLSHDRVTTYSFDIYDLNGNLLYTFNNIRGCIKDAFYIGDKLCVKIVPFNIYNKPGNLCTIDIIYKNKPNHMYTSCYNDIQPLGDYLLIYNRQKYGLAPTTSNPDDSHEIKCSIPIKYDSISIFGEYFLLSQNDEYILSTGNYEQILPFSFNSIEQVNNNLLIGVKGLYGLYTNTGNQVLPIEYSNIKFINNYILVSQNGLYGLYTNTGNQILPVQYNDIDFIDGYLIVSQNNKYGLYTLKGKKILPIEYQSISITNLGENIFKAYDFESGVTYIDGEDKTEFKSEYDTGEAELIQKMKNHLAHKEALNYRNPDYLIKKINEYCVQKNVPNLQANLQKFVEEYKRAKMQIFNSNLSSIDDVIAGKSEYLDSNQNFQVDHNYLHTLQSIYDSLPMIDIVLTAINKINIYLYYLCNKVKVPSNNQDEVLSEILIFKSIAEHMDETRCNRNLNALTTMLETERKRLEDLIGNMTTNNQIKTFDEKTWYLNLNVLLHPLVENLANDINSYKIEKLSEVDADTKKQINDKYLNQAQMIIDTNKDLIDELKEYYDYLKNTDLTQVNSIAAKINEFNSLNVYDYTKTFTENMESLFRLTKQIIDYSHNIESIVNNFKVIFTDDQDTTKKVA